MRPFALERLVGHVLEEVGDLSEGLDDVALSV